MNNPHADAVFYGNTGFQASRITAAGQFTLTCTAGGSAGILFSSCQLGRLSTALAYSDTPGTNCPFELYNLYTLDITNTATSFFLGTGNTAAAISLPGVVDPVSTVGGTTVSEGRIRCCPQGTSFTISEVQPVLNRGYTIRVIQAPGCLLSYHATAGAFRSPILDNLNSPPESVVAQGTPVMHLKIPPNPSRGPVLTNYSAQHTTAGAEHFGYVRCGTSDTAYTDARLDDFNPDKSIALDTLIVLTPTDTTRAGHFIVDVRTREFSAIFPALANTGSDVSKTPIRPLDRVSPFNPLIAANQSRWKAQSTAARQRGKVPGLINVVSGKATAATGAGLGLYAGVKTALTRLPNSAPSTVVSGTSAATADAAGGTVSAETTEAGGSLLSELAGDALEGLALI